MRDVVVVGAGHNGLVAACYLARAGLDVEVVERREVAGGAVSTVERLPGYHMDVGSSAHIMVRHTGIPEELALEETGLVYQDLDPWGFAPFGDAALTFHVDLGATCESIAAVCGDRDAHAYEAFVRDWGRRNERVLAAFAEPPTRGLRHLWRLGHEAGVGGLELSRQFLTSGEGLLDCHFDDERLKTALAWLGAQAGPSPQEPATADLVGWNALLHHRPPGHPEGGSGMLAVALVRRLAALGGQLRLGDGARRIVVRDGVAQGVDTDSGERVAARVVVAACHVLTTADLVGDDPAVGAGWLGAADRLRRTVRTGGGSGMVARLACDRLPRYSGGTGAEHRALQLLCPSREVLHAARGDFLAGRPPQLPPVLGMTFSAFDEQIAPPGKHNVSLWGQWYPYRLSSGESWEAITEREADKLIAAVDAAAPGFADGVEAVVVQTPVDIERELGMIDGQVMHLEMSLDQMFAWRPLPELAGYRTPADGLYLTGASTHPGGGVFGASGRSAARTVLSDLAGGWRDRLRRRRR